MEKKDFISSLIAGEDVADLFIISEASRAQAKNGPYWQLVLKDKTGSLPARVWSPLSLAFQEMPVGELAFVKGRTSMYGEALQLIVEDLEPLNSEDLAKLDLSLFLPSSSIPADKMWEDLRLLCSETLVHPPLRALALAILDDEKIRAQLLTAPAAKGVHHAYRGGLLEHLLSVCKLCMLMADSYAELDRQILLVGALCHDLGKLAELTSGNTIDYTNEGRLLGHIDLGVELLNEFLQKIPLEKELAFHLRHLVLSHHGELEFGSPKRPKTPEAFVLHMADNVDAKLAMFRDIFKDIPRGTWSPFNKIMDRFLYRPSHASNASNASNIFDREDKPNPGQVAQQEGTREATSFPDSERSSGHVSKRSSGRSSGRSSESSALNAKNDLNAEHADLAHMDFYDEQDASSPFYELEESDMWEILHEAGEAAEPREEEYGQPEQTFSAHTGLGTSENAPRSAKPAINASPKWENADADAQMTEEAPKQGIGQTVEQAAERAIEQAVGQTIEQAAERAIERAAGQTIEQAAERAIGQMAGQTIEQATEQAAERAAEQGIGQEKKADQPEASRGAQTTGGASGQCSLLLKG